MIDFREWGWLITPDIEDHPSLEESECAVATEEDPVDDPDEPPEYEDDE